MCVIASNLLPLIPLFSSGLQETKQEVGEIVSLTRTGVLYQVYQDPLTHINIVILEGIR